MFPDYHDVLKARLRDLSAFTDEALLSFMERLRDELMREQASPQFVSGIAQAIAIHIARNQQTRTFELRAALSLAKLYQRIGRDQVASELLAPALVGFNAGPEVPEVEEARRLIAMHEPVAKLIS